MSIDYVICERPLTTIYQIPEADPLPMVAVQGTEDAGCYVCGKCCVCKENFLSPCSEFSGHCSKHCLPDYFSGVFVTFVYK